MNEFDLILWLEREWVSKESLMKSLNMSERAVRDYMAELNIRLSEHGKCILSTASRKGFHIPSFYREEDLALAHQIDKELESKAISIFERRKAIRNYIQFSATAKDAEHQEQLTLF